VDDFAKYLILRPTDANWALWKYVARAKDKADAKQLLAADTLKFDLTKWPGPAINYFLGNITAEQVRTAASQGDAKDVARQQCETAFFIGEYLVLTENDLGKKQLQEAVTSCPHSSPQYGAAVAELARLK
jgi:lipoprotein NlpI